MKTMKLIVGLSVLFLAAGVFAQGSLTPPGAPGEMMKTLEQIEPRIDLATVSGNPGCRHIVSQPGSYYLSENVAVSNISAILINAENVAIDLNGFEISNVSSNGYAIWIEGGMDRITVRNGSITGFGFGVDSGTVPASPEGCLFEKLVVSDCSSLGLWAGTASRLVNCIAYDNGGNGLSAGDGSVLSGCTAHNNQSNGIVVGIASTLKGCSAQYNKGVGILAGSDCVLTDCAAQNNSGGFGIYADRGSTVANCSGCLNSGSGSASYGIYVGNGSTVEGCSARGNANMNYPTTALQGVGIGATGQSTIRNCTVSDNQGDGIRVYGWCVVEGNNCSNNGSGGDGAGIHATGDANRIDGNTVFDNDRGIDVDKIQNLIVCNSAEGNHTNYVVVSTNAVGQIVDYSTSGGIISNVSPWANFSF